jgi:hypothetical protein
MILIGQPHQRRTRMLQHALQARGMVTAITIDWADVLSTPEDIAARLRSFKGYPIKIDSPGESPELHDGLIQHGWRCMGEPGAPPHRLAHGELAHQHLWYAGFADLLRKLAAGVSNARWLNAPRDILRLCDKRDCQEHLMSAGIDTPPLLGPVDGYAQLHDRIRADGIDRIFVKARFGSSAAGVVAYRRHRDGREVAYSSAEIQNQSGDIRIFNSLRVRRHTHHHEIATLINAIAAQGAYAEHWIAKPRATHQARANFDLRVVAFAGVPRQRVARIASQPMTNLHLGNRRGDVARSLDAEGVRRFEHTVQRAAAVFPHSTMIGFDLIPTGGRVLVLEANTFGDLLPGLLWQNMSTYDDQAAWCADFYAARNTKAHADLSQPHDTQDDEAAAYA